MSDSLRASDLALLATLLLPLPALAQSPGSGIGAVETARGSAQAQQGEVVRALRADDAVLFMDRLVTGPDGRLAVTLDDESRLTLGEQASLTIDRFVYNPAGGKTAGQLAVNVLRGAFLFVGGRVEERKGAKVTIKTSAATLGVRGTTVWGGPIDGGFGVLVVSGRVTVSTPGGTVSLTRGQGTLVDGAGRLDRPAPWGQSRIDRAFAQVSFGSGAAPGSGPLGLPPAGRQPGLSPQNPSVAPSPSPSFSPAPSGGGIPGGAPGVTGPGGNGGGVGGAAGSGQGSSRGQ